MGWTDDIRAEYEKQLENQKKYNFCELCRRFVNLRDPYQKKTHENGRRHQKNAMFSKIGM